MTHLEFVQGEATKNMDFHMQNMDNLQTEGNTTATFLSVAVSASFSAAVSIFAAGNHMKLALALSFLCVYLAIVGAYLVFACLRARYVQPPTNEPKNLKLQDGFTSEQIQQFELENLQGRIDSNRIRNDKAAWHLNCVRLLIFASPAFFSAVLAFIALAAMLAHIC